MSISQTHGYHLVVELSNNRLAGIIDDFIPNPLSFNIATGIDATASKIPGRPSTVTIVSGNTFSVSAVRRIQILTFQFNIRVSLQAHLNVNGGQISLNYPSAPVITADTPGDQTTLQNLVTLANSVNSTSFTVAQMLQMGAQNLLSVLQNSFSLPNIPVGMPFNSGPCAISLNRIDLHTITNSLFILLQFSGAGIPLVALNAAAFTTSLRGGRDSVLVLANDALLAIAACFIGQDPISPLQGTHFVTSGTCTTMQGHKHVNAGGHDIDVSNLRICVVGNQLVVSGNAATSGTGYSATGSFSAPIGFDCHADGTIFPIFDPNNVQTNVHISFDWWVYLVGFAAAAIAGIVLGPLVGIILSIVVALLGPIASVIGNAIARNALSGLSQSLNQSVSQGYQMAPPALLQVLGEIRCQQVILDDFAMQGFMNPHATPHVSITETDTITNRVEAGSGGSGYLGAYIDYNTATQAVFSATGSFFKLPLTVSWYIGNTHVTGNGSMSLNGRTISYAVAGNKCTVQTQTGDAVTGVIRAMVRGADGFAKSKTALIAVSGKLRDFPGQDQLHDLLERVSHYAVIQGWPFRKPIPDPPPYAAYQIDLQNSFHQAAQGIAGKGNIGKQIR